MRQHAWTWHQWGTVALCCVSFVAAGLISDLVLEQVPHLEDEVAYLFQAQVFASGKAHAEAPFDTSCFFAPFVVDHEGRRFGKYPPGWPALLAMGVALGQAWWVNAAGAALTTALVCRLGQSLHGRQVAVTSAALATASPFVLLLAGSLMPHTWSLVFVTVFLWCYYEARTRTRHRDAFALGCGAALGGVFAIRPFTALAIGLPAAGDAAWRLVRERSWRVPWFGALGFVPLALVVPAFNALCTGDPLQSGYQLVWPYDRIGFGPGTGPAPGGNTVWLGLSGSLAALGHLANHLLGWPTQSLTFAVLAFVFRPRRRWEVFLALTAFTLVLAYALYWTSGDVFGPRYAYESSSALLVLSAAGIVRAGQWMHRRGRLWLFAAVLSVLVAANLSLYLPGQLSSYRGLYGITARPREIVAAADLSEALVIVREERGWWDYAALFSLNEPTLDGEIVYASDCGSENDQLVARYPGRSVYTFDSATMTLVPGLLR